MKYLEGPAHTFLGLMFALQFYRSIKVDKYYGNPAFIPYDCLYYEDKKEKQKNFWPSLFVFLTAEGFYLGICFLFLIYQFFFLSLYFALMFVAEYKYLKDF